MPVKDFADTQTLSIELRERTDVRHLTLEAIAA